MRQCNASIDIDDLADFRSQHAAQTLHGFGGRRVVRQCGDLHGGSFGIACRLLAFDHRYGHACASADLVCFQPPRPDLASRDIGLENGTSARTGMTLSTRPWRYACFQISDSNAR
jgi:hypothetical protein